MLEVLDPRIDESLLAFDNVIARVEEVAVNQRLYSQLRKENVDQKVAELLKTNPNLQERYIRKYVLSRIASSFCLRGLMSDGKGRAETHMIGEVCRMTRILRNRTSRDDLGIFSEFNDSFKISSSADTTWTYDGTTHIYPTIDGLNPRIPALGGLSKEFMFLKPLHTDWYNAFRDYEIPIACGEYLKQVDPPFLLNSGEIVAGFRPTYFIIRQEPVPDPTRTPSQLIGA